MYKLLVLFLFTVFNLQYARAGSIINKNQSKELYTNCIQSDDSGKCSQYEIIFRNLKNGEEKTISKYSVKVVSDPDEIFLLKDKIKKFKPFPLSHEVFAYGQDRITFQSIQDAHYEYTDGLGGMILGSGCITIIVGAVIGAEVVMLVGAGTFLAAPALIFLVPVADIVSMPVRALVRKLKLRNITKNEALAFNALNVMISEESDLTLSNAKFNKLMNTLGTLK